MQFIHWTAANEWWGARGEIYYGQALSEYNGGILQSFNSTTFQEIHSAGGFGEVFCYLTDDFHGNETLFANFVWDLSQAVQLGLQVDYRKTNCTQFLPNAFLDSDAVVVASRFLWRF